MNMRSQCEHQPNQEEPKKIIGRFWKFPLFDVIFTTTWVSEAFCLSLQVNTLPFTHNMLLLCEDFNMHLEGWLTTSLLLSYGRSERPLGISWKQHSKRYLAVQLNPNSKVRSTVLTPFLCLQCTHNTLIALFHGKKLEHELKRHFFPKLVDLFVIPPSPKTKWSMSCGPFHSLWLSSII